ncbi:unnamed protein product [Amoebophrya sp. A25]|nr:unnamed protein product [Amoebophrya sp. A25]|eukprot:GSA25T00025348001.1
MSDAEIADRRLLRAFAKDDDDIEVEIVLSTAWRHSRDRTEVLKNVFMEVNGFPLPWIGSTDRLEDDLNPATARCFEIRAFLEMHFPQNQTRWICIDDLQLDINQADGASSEFNEVSVPIEKERFVWTRSAHGLTPELAKRAERQLLDQPPWVLDEDEILY